jgi:hypothetical protein
MRQKKLLTLKQFARYLGKSENTIKKAVQKGHIRRSLLGSRYYYDAETSFPSGSGEAANQ